MEWRIILVVVLGTLLFLGAVAGMAGLVRSRSFYVPIWQATDTCALAAVE